MSTPKTIGRYEVIEELGHGAMGTVYRAKDPAMDRVVALKTILAAALVSQQGTEFRERFYREARTAGKLAHPGIVPVFDVGEHEGVPFLVMEFVNGRTLESVAKSGERLTLERVCEIGQQIAEALSFAHRQGVVHRDIKPANILITSRESHGIERPKITDFGIAKMAAGSITMSGQIMGTPAFMPPEQFTGAPVDGRADIFSLGVILYWLSTGEEPFHGETLTAVSYKVVHVEPVPPSKLNPSVPPALEGILLKCLAKSPAARYQTGDELARDLSALRAGTIGASLQRTAMHSPVAIEADATLDYQTAPPAKVTQVAPAPPVNAASSTAQKRNWLFPAAAILIAVLAGGWYFLRGHHRSAASEPPSTSAPASASASAAAPAPAAPGSTTPPTPAPAAALGAPAKPTSAAGEALKQSANTPQGSAAKLSVANANPSAAAGALAAKTTPVAAAPAEPAAAVVDFDPKSMDANANAKLKIDPPRVPDAVQFTIEMNGKTYYEWSGAGNKSEYQNLFVPPGVQEFRVTGRSGPAKVTSNIVSTDFKAKKRKTLKIELRNPAKPAEKDAPPLSSDSQIFVTLK